jgi:hypothetical protein
MNYLQDPDGYKQQPCFSVSEIRGEAPRLERTVLSKGIARQRRALRGFIYFDANRGRIGSADSGEAQHGILAEHLAINLGDEIVLPVGITAPDLPELDGINGHF